VDTPHCLGVEITVFDPDYDADSAYAEEIASTIVAGLASVRSAPARPDLIAARRDLAARAEPVPVEERRAAAAGESVALAAAGMSGGGPPPGVPEEAAAPATTLLGVEEADEVEARPVEEPSDASDASDEEPTALSGEEPTALPEEEPAPDGNHDGASDDSAEPDTPAASRPLGSAPLLDSEPLPATRPGMLRPRSPEGFSLPAQRPAFDAGPEKPADIA
jgi:arginase